jgi:TonB family protein
MYRSCTGRALISASIFFVLVSGAWCQQQQTDSNRRVVVKVDPEYPHLARTMNITGVVKLEALVASNGSVKLLHVKGGHPVLAEAAAAAVNRWKWERTQQETTESVQIQFNPERH